MATTQPIKPGVIDSAAKPVLEKVKTEAVARQTAVQPGVKPITGEVKPESTVANQMTGLLDENSPYIQQARDDSRRYASGRGLINTSIAARAGEEAVIKSALPIATQDASTHFTQQRDNQGVINKFRENRQSTDLNKELDTHQSGNTIERMNVEEANKETFAKLDNDLAMLKDTHSADLKIKVDTILADIKINSDMKAIFAQETSRIMTETQAQIGLVGSSDRTSEQQASAIDQIIKQRDASITLLTNLMQASTQWDWFSDTAVPGIDVNPNTPPGAAPPPAAAPAAPAAPTAAAPALGGTTGGSDDPSSPYYDPRSQAPFSVY